MSRERHRRTIRSGVAVAASLITVAATASVAAAAPADPGPASIAPDGPSRSVTLVTGDQVRVTPREGRVPLVAVEPGPGRDGTGFAVHATKDDIVVLPTDAVPLLADGRLDRRLFDVDRLLASGYGDAERNDLPLIAKRPVAALRAGARTVSPGGLTAVRADKSDLGRTWRAFVADPSARLWLDGKVKASLDGSVPRIGAPAAWEKGLTGEGVTVAVLDSGVDADHPDLTVAAAENFTSAPSADDVYGHGTHVASVLAGSGEASGGRYRGVAPDARIVSGKVLGDGGYGQESWLIAGMTWAAQEMDADVVNLSVSCFCDSPAIDPVEQAVNDLSAETGTLFVAPAGDVFWPAPGVIALPAAAESALAVSSVDEQDRPASLVRGPHAWDHLVKPEIVAPGVGIVAARAGGTSVGSPVDANYTRLSGTSVATPHVAGAAAILAQQHPGWDGQRIKSTLMASAKRLPVDPGYQGAGRVDVGKAVAQNVSASPPSLHADVEWPDSGPAEVTREITYQNSSDQPVDLELGLELAGGDGAPLPSGAASFDRTSVTVPANGEVGATLTLRGMDGVTAGVYTGTVTASAGGGPVVTTPVAAYMEPPTSIVTFSATDRDGDSTNHPVIVLLSNVETREYFVAEPQSDGTVTARVPVGTYSIAAQFKGGSNWTNGFQRIRELPAGATAVPLDARKNAPVEFTNDRSDAELTDAKVTLSLATDEHSSGMYVYGDAQRKISVETNPDDRFGYNAIATWRQKDADPGPYAFHDYRTTADGIPADPSLHTRTANMARIHMSIREQGGIAGGTLRSYVRTSDGETGQGDVSLPAPGTFTLYVRAGEELAWSNVLRLYDKAGEELFSHSMTSRPYKARNYTHVWNGAVLGPRPSTIGNQREGNGLEVGVSCARTAALGSCGRGHTGTGTLTLSRDGTVLDEKEIGGNSLIDIEATVPAEPATYTVHESLTWPDLPAGSVTTAVDSVWTFRSAETPEARSLPLMSVRYLPAGLDERNRAPGDRATVVPYWIGHNAGASQARVEGVEIEASFDDGETWRRLRTAGIPALGIVRIDPPSGAEFVSLRATAEDADGNKVRQTVIRAYGLS